MKIMVIPDTQVKPGISLEHLEWTGKYMVDKKPDVVVHLGDFADMWSLSSYDVGKKSFEGRRYLSDIEAAHNGMRLLLGPLWDYNNRAAKNHEKRYQPRRVMLGGNHEERIIKAVENDAKLDGVLSLNDLSYEEFGWEYHAFLRPVIIEGVAFCHYFPSGVLGRPVTTATALLNKMHMSCVAGHLPGLQFARSARADGCQLTGIIAGSFYQHEEEYMAPIVNRQHWHGILMLHDVHDGDFDIMPVSINYLRRKYGNGGT